jgi:hypothetical protein
MQTAGYADGTGKAMDELHVLTACGAAVRTTLKENYRPQHWPIVAFVRHEASAAVQLLWGHCYRGIVPCVSVHRRNIAVLWGKGQAVLWGHVSLYTASADVTLFLVCCCCCCCCCAQFVCSEDERNFCSEDERNSCFQLEVIPRDIQDASSYISMPHLTAQSAEHWDTHSFSLRSSPTDVQKTWSCSSMPHLAAHSTEHRNTLFILWVTQETLRLLQTVRLTGRDNIPWFEARGQFLLVLLTTVVSRGGKALGNETECCVSAH